MVRIPEVGWELQELVIQEKRGQLVFYRGLLVFDVSQEKGQGIRSHSANRFRYGSCFVPRACLVIFVKPLTQPLALIHRLARTHQRRQHQGNDGYSQNNDGRSLITPLHAAQDYLRGPEAQWGILLALTLSSPFKNRAIRRVRARGLHHGSKNRTCCRPGPLTGRFLNGRIANPKSEPRELGSQAFNPLRTPPADSDRSPARGRSPA